MMALRLKLRKKYKLREPQAEPAHPEPSEPEEEPEEKPEEKPKKKKKEPEPEEEAFWSPLGSLVQEARALLDAPPWDAIEEVYGVSGHQPKGYHRPPKYPGLEGSRHKKAIAKGYVDLGLSDPEGPWKTKSASYVGSKLAKFGLARMLMTKGSGFIRDPEGVLKNRDLKKVAKGIRDYVAGVFAEYPGIDAELPAIKKKVQKTKVKLEPVKGKTAKGYRVTSSPSLAWASK
jgi:hypothetical protein